jgi:hypothetical protein
LIRLTAPQREARESALDAESAQIAALTHDNASSHDSVIHDSAPSRKERWQTHGRQNHTKEDFDIENTGLNHQRRHYT